MGFCYFFCQKQLFTTRDLLASQKITRNDDLVTTCGHHGFYYNATPEYGTARIYFKNSSY